MGELELLLLEYYRSRPAETLSEQEMDEYLYLLVKEGLAKRQVKIRWIK
ncbi:hypothetical protein ES708_20160 [subsurface metagenome]